MRIAIDIDSGAVRTWAGENVSFLPAKRRDRFPVEVQYRRNGVVVALADGAAGVLGLKPPGALSGGFVAAASSWSVSGYGAGRVYVFDLNLNTTQLEALFTQEPASVALAVEVAVTTQDGERSSATFNMVVANDVVRGDEGSPTQALDLKATQADAEAGSDNTKWMTPLRTAQAFAGAQAAISSLQSAINEKADVDHTHPKGDVGLGNVDNTSDANKPVSTATQTALNGKANTAHAHAIGDVTGLQTALDGKQPTGSYVLTSDSRLTDARTPTAHKTTHAIGGSDALTPADIGAITDAPSNGTLYGRKNATWTAAASPSDLPSPLPTFVSGGAYGTQFVVGDIPASWQEASDITQLYIGNSATSIGSVAFNQCSNLTGNLVIPNSVTSIGDGAFRECASFNGTLTIGNSVTSIGSYAFEGTAFNGNLIIGNSVITIGDNAFNNGNGQLANFSSLTIGNSVTTIGDGAFLDGSFSGNLILPNSLTSIGSYAFQYCTDFTGNLVIPNSVTTIGSSAFRYCSGFDGTLTLGNSVTSIGSGAFYYCQGFTGSLTIPNSVTSIEGNAFKSCSGFTGSIVIPNSVTSIGSYAFVYTGGFTGNLVIPNSTTTFGVRAFAFSGLTAAYLNQPIGSIGSYAFYGSNITNVYIGPDATGYTLGAGQNIGEATVTVSAWTNYPNFP
jgi:hypothetical protein